MTVIKRRGPRLEWMAAPALIVGLALLIPGAWAQTATLKTATRTTLSVDPSGQAAATVQDFDGLPVAGVVSFERNGVILGQKLLDANGQATAKLTLGTSDQALQAVYAGSTSDLASSSALQTVHPEDSSSGTAGFELSLAAVSPATLPMTLTAGESGSVTVTVTPVNNDLLTAPMFITLSCSGLPSDSSCSFAPSTVEILPTTATSCSSSSSSSDCPPTSLMVIQTGAATGMLTPGPRRANPVEWALLLPGFVVFGGMAWAARRRRWLQRIALIALIGVVTVLGTTACSPLYNYYNHGPPTTPATPSGTYTVTVTGQSTNGVTAITDSTTMVLTVD